MKTMELKKGFTLIELLVVMAIIGILAAALLVSLGGSRKVARDTTRVSDLRNIAASFELYYNLCAGYPWGLDCDNTSNPGVGNWTALSDVMKGTLNLTNFPKEALNGHPEYEYDVNGTNQTYLLKATLEDQNAAVNNDIDEPDPISSSIDCGSGGASAGEVEYCTSI